MNKKALTPKQKEVLGYIRNTELAEFTAAELSADCGNRVAAQTLNALTERGFLVKIAGSSPNKYKKQSKEQMETAASALEAPVTKIIKEGDIIDKLFSLEAMITEELNKTIHYMNNDTYATKPGTQLGIYQIIDSETEKVVYVGKTERPFTKRWKEHKELLANGRHHSPKLQEYFDSLDRDFTKIRFEILQELPLDSKTIDLRERYWIDKHSETILNYMKPRLIK